MEKALKGFTVLDFGLFLPGPYSSMLLGDRGAEVIKIESPSGDPLREEKGAKSENSREGYQDQIKKEVQYVLADYSNYWK